MSKMIFFDIHNGRGKIRMGSIFISTRLILFNQESGRSCHLSRSCLIALIMGIRLRLHRSPTLGDTLIPR